MRKVLLISLGAIIVIVAAAAYFTFTNLDSIVKGLIEEFGSEAAGTKVQVGEVDISLSKGKATIKKLTVANPPGYSPNPVIALGQISIEIDTDTGVIKEIYTSGATFRLEQKEKTSNIEELKKKVEKEASPKGSEAEGSKETQEDEPKGEPTKIKIDLVKMENTLVIILSAKGEKVAELKIKSIEFRNLKGTPQEVAEQILNQLTQSIMISTVQQTIKSQLEDVIKQQGDQAGEFFQKLFK